MNETQNNIKQVSVEGNNYGQIAVGDGWILQIGSVTGGVVNITPPELKPVIKPRTTPVLIRPRKMTGMLDRKEALDTAVEEITNGTPVEFYAESGEGKTALLRALAYHPDSTAFPDGVVYLLGRDQPVDDLMQSLYDAFYESSIPYKPSEAQIRIDLNGKRALVLLDDLDINSSQIQTLMDVAVNCVFVMASRERRMYGEGRSCTLPGLPEADAQGLFMRELGRALAAGEGEEVLAICRMLDGHPLHLLQASGFARETHIALNRFAAYLRQGDPVERLNEALLHGLKEDEKRVVSALAMMAGVPFPLRHIDSLVGNAPESMIRLLQMGRLTVEGDRVMIPERLGAYIRQLWPDSGQSVFEGMTRVLAEARNAPGGIRQMADLIDPAMQVIKVAVDQRSWENVLRLAKLLDPLLVMDRRWQAWQYLLEQALEAATALEDLAGRAWALHQLGTRSLLLGDPAARGQLVKALRLRQLIGDRAGEAVTRHNLQFLIGPGWNNDSRDDGGPGSGTGGGSGGIVFPKAVALMSIAAVVVVATGLLLIALFPPPIIPISGGISNERQETPTEPPFNIPVTTMDYPPPEGTVTNTFTPTNTATNTPTITATVTATSTNTPTPCGPLAGWVPYRIRRGDTLYRLAAVTGTNVQTILLANCMNNVGIIAGNTLWLPTNPPLPPTITPTPTNTFTPTPTNTQTPQLELVVDITFVEPRPDDWQVGLVFSVRNLSDVPSMEPITAQFFIRSMVEASQDHPGDMVTVNPPGPNSSESIQTSILLPLEAWYEQPVRIYAKSGDRMSNLAEVTFPPPPQPDLELVTTINWVEHTSNGWQVGTSITAYNTGKGDYAEGLIADVYVNYVSEESDTWRVQTIEIPGPIKAGSSSETFLVVDLAEDMRYAESVSIYAISGNLTSNYAEVPFPPPPVPTPTTGGVDLNREPVLVATPAPEATPTIPTYYQPYPGG